MNYFQTVKKEYLRLSNNQYFIPILIKDFTFNKWDELINNCTHKQKFKIEFLTFPLWGIKNNDKSSYVKINKNYYTHIKIKI